MTFFTLMFRTKSNQYLFFSLIEYNTKFSMTSNLNSTVGLKNERKAAQV